LEEEKWGFRGFGRVGKNTQEIEERGDREEKRRVAPSPSRVFELRVRNKGVTGAEWGSM